jgi:hypothetical protein
MMRKRGGARAALACMVGIVLARDGAASADPSRLVIAPAGWRADPEQASALAQRFAATSHFGGLSAVTAAEAYVADRPGVALFATRATAMLPAGEAQAARASKAALDALRASSGRSGLTGGSAEEESWHEQVETQARQVTATLGWRDPTSHAIETARVVVASDGKRIVAVTGECLANVTADRGAVAACAAALASLDPGIAVAQRVPLALAAASADDTSSPVRGAASAGSTAQRAPTTMSVAPGEPAASNDRVRMPPMTIAPDARSNDRRTGYVGAGVVVLAAMFWWNRRRRDRFEREDRGAPPRPAARDDDADDLHAAARSEAPDAPDRHDRPSRRDRRDPP